MMAPRKRPVEDRVAPKIALTDSGCIEWIAFVERNGYARIWIDGRNVGAHRWSYEYHVGPIPEGLHIDHLCRNTVCINPDHLEPVTPSENTRRGVGPQVKRWLSVLATECPNGHPYGEDSIPDSSGRRCLTCKRAGNRAFYERNRELTIERARQWQLANPERARQLARETARRQRAKKKAS